jgi:hypothetical protein
MRKPRPRRGFFAFVLRMVEGVPAKRSQGLFTSEMSDPSWYAAFRQPSSS